MTSLARIDVSAGTDTELGAEVRHLFAEGRTLVALFDGCAPDRRASTWVDGTHGLYRMECRKGHEWLTALRMEGLFQATPGAVQPDCPTCGSVGEWVES